MSFSKPNYSAATLTTTRVTPAPISGICVTCLDGCEGPCEIGRSALKGKEVIYPMPFGLVTAGSEKDYPVDFSHFNIQGTAVGAIGIEPDPDIARFPSVDTKTAVGSDGSIKMDFPVFTGAVGSTDIARINVEDTKLGVPEYVIEKLGVKIFELKWGQGAKDIGGEVKLRSMERALQLNERGYIVLPDPTTSSAQEAFKAGGITEFERHSRLGMVEEESFHKAVAYLRSIGAKYVTLKTGAYRPADLARAIKDSSDAKIH